MGIIKSRRNIEDDPADPDKEDTAAEAPLEAAVAAVPVGAQPGPEAAAAAGAATITNDNAGETTNDASATEDADGESQPQAPEEAKKTIKLYKSSRLKPYLTLLLSSVINYDAAQKSSDVIDGAAVPATDPQRKYAVAVSTVSMVLSGFVFLAHLDRITPLERVWIRAFSPKSRLEASLAVFLILWWSVAVGVQTSVQGIAGDGKGQYSLYYSAWVCCWTSYWILERWWVAAGYSSLKSFITSWPYRAPGWICILFLSIFTMIWYIDLWRNHHELQNRDVEFFLYENFASVPSGQWQWLVALVVLTIIPAAFFVLIEIFRETKADGSNQEKEKAENFMEGIIILCLVLSWAASIIIATIPGGAASLVGNAYFFSWALVTFIVETGVWFVHDLRARVHKTLRQQASEYEEKQKQVLEKAQAIQKKKARQERVRLHRYRGDSFSSDEEDDGEEESTGRRGDVSGRDRTDTEFFDAVANHM